jgi:hypothetical protein
MNRKGAYIEHKGKAVEMDSRFKHVMAISLDPRSGYREGVVRCITSRNGDVAIKGNVDRSVLCKTRGDFPEHFEIGEELKIGGQKEIIEKLGGEEWDFIGLEDPDIWIESPDIMHLYFTMPFLGIGKMKHKWQIHLGHAVGKNLDMLQMTEPALQESERSGGGAKELSVAPVNKSGVRLNLIESSDKIDDVWYSTVRIARADDVGKPWQFGKTVFHPKDGGIKWAGGHASPGPLLSKNFIDVGEGKMLGIMNGREANKTVNGKVVYGVFSVGLFIYDYENGKIDWVSPEPLIIDSEAKNITFSSQFVENGAGEGILYAHVDDSFVRAYTLFADQIKKLLP